MSASDRVEKPLTGPQTKAIAALMTATTIVAAAKTAGCSERSIRRWLKEPHFAEALNEAQRETLAAVQRRMASLSLAATSALARALDDGKPIGAQLRAADIVFARGQQIRELNELETRLAALESVQVKP